MIYKEKVLPKIFKNVNFLDFRIFGGDVNRAHGRHNGSSAMPLAEVIHEIRLKNKKSKFFEKLYFFDEKYFSKDFFSKKVDFLKILMFFNKNRKKWLFEIFGFSKSFEKYLSSKKYTFSDFFYILFLYRSSCITSSSGIAELPLSRPWARLTSPPKIQKSRKFTFLKILGGTFSL